MHKGILGLILAADLIAPAAARAQERWLADLKVTMTATEDASAGIIKHVVRVTNQGDDTARDVGITHIPVVGMAVVDYSSTSGTCHQRSYNNNAAWVIHCPVAAMNVGVTETVVVVTRNTTAWPGLKVTTAQAMGASPDRRGSDNVVEIVFP